MKKVNRRKFIYSAALAASMPTIMTSFGGTNTEKNEIELNDRALLKNIPIGMISTADNPEEDLKKVRDWGFPTCQLVIKDYSPELATRLSRTLKEYKILPTTLICMGPGAYIYNFKDGPSTIGLIPRKTRPERIERLKQGIDFCREADIPAVHAHFGFIPENPKDILYIEFVGIMKNIGEYALKRGIDVYFETGQETPITLRRAIEDVGTGNLYVNYDTANLLMYDKANPLDGLQILDKYVKSLHAKDGKYPTDTYKLGQEMAIPEGDVDFPKIISTLKNIGFKGAITIEYELAGSDKEYMLKTKKYLENLILSV